MRKEDRWRGLIRKGRSAKQERRVLARCTLGMMCPQQFKIQVGACVVSKDTVGVVDGGSRGRDEGMGRTGSRRDGGRG